MAAVAGVLCDGAPATSFAGPCDALGQAIAARTQATIDRITPEFGNVVFSHNAAYEMTLLCGAAPPSLFLSYEGRADARFLALASVAGGIAAGRAISATTIGECLKAAEIDPAGEVERDRGGLHLDCAVNVADETGNVTISRPQ